MATGIDLPGCLHYDWQENHFRALTAEASAVTRRIAVPVEEATRAEETSTRTNRFLEALAIVLPAFSLLPPITDPTARAALALNIEAEKRMMYRYIYGGLSHPEYEAFRSGTAFQTRDRLIDSAERFHQAERNLTILLETRELTKEVRPHAQRVILDVVNGTRSIEDVRSELEHVRAIIEAALEAMPTTTSLYVTSSAQFVLGLLEGAESLSGHGSPIVAMQSLKALFEALHGVHQAKRTAEFYSFLGRQYPLSWIAAVHGQRTRQE